MHYLSPFHKTIETAIYRKGGEGQEYRFNWYPPFLITLKMKTCNDRIAIYLLNCELNFCICSGFSELCTYLLLLNLISPLLVLGRDVPDMIIGMKLKNKDIRPNSFFTFIVTS